MHSLVRRLPMALGPVVGGFLITTYGEKSGVQLAFVVALLLGGVSLILQQTLIQEVRKSTRAELNPIKMFPLMSPELRSLLTSDILIRFC